LTELTALILACTLWFETSVPAVSHGGLVQLDQVPRALVVVLIVGSFHNFDAAVSLNRRQAVVAIDGGAFMLEVDGCGDRSK